MNRIRTRLVLIFLAGTLVPLGITAYVATSLLEQSLRFSPTDQLDRISKSLERTGRELYEQARASVKRDAEENRLEAQRYPVTETTAWPESVRDFWESGQQERFNLTGEQGQSIAYYVRKRDAVWVYERETGGEARLGEVLLEYRSARRTIDTARHLDLRRGLTTTLLVAVGGVWVVSLALLWFLAHRITQPVHELTVGLQQLAAGRLETRVRRRSNDEVGEAVEAFNHMAEQLQRSKERLVYLTQVASWQVLGRKMAHELKNSLTPIRLTVEEMVARYPESERGFMEQAAQIVVNEVESLERRVRAFSEFSAEPPVRPAMLMLNEVAAERVAFLRAGHARVEYRCGWEAGSEGEQAHAASAGPVAWADEDLVRGILTNLLENAAEALPESEGGRVEVRTGSTPNYAWVEVHDSGPGLPEPVRLSLFEPAISFKKRGMGLGLSIARKNALACGGELRLIESALGGAGFRLELPLPAEGMAGRERPASQQAGQNWRQTHGGKTGVAGDAAKVRA